MTGGIQAKVSHYQERYARLLAEFAAAIADEHGVEVDSRVYDVPDPSVEVDSKLLDAIAETGADLVVMASHQPGWAEYWSTPTEAAWPATRRCRCLWCEMGVNRLSPSAIRYPFNKWQPISPFRPAAPPGKRLPAPRQALPTL